MMSCLRIRSGLLAVALMAGSAVTFAANSGVVRLEPDTAVLKKLLLWKRGRTLNMNWRVSV